MRGGSGTAERFPQGLDDSTIELPLLFGRQRGNERLQRFERMTRRFRALRIVIGDRIEDLRCSDRAAVIRAKRAEMTRAEPSGIGCVTHLAFETVEERRLFRRELEIRP